MKVKVVFFSLFRPFSSLLFFFSATKMIIVNKISAPIGAMKCNLPRFKEIMTGQPTNQQTDMGEVFCFQQINNLSVA